jgi:hypothetical protein
MSGVSTPWTESSRWLGKSRTFIVSFFSGFFFSVIVVIASYRFLYTLFIAVDGNFKLKGKERNIKDVDLMPGWGAYVPETEYQSHIASCVGQKEVRVILPYPLSLSTNDIISG